MLTSVMERRTQDRDSLFPSTVLLLGGRYLTDPEACPIQPSPNILPKASARVVPRTLSLQPRVLSGKAFPARPGMHSSCASSWPGFPCHNPSNGFHRQQLIQAQPAASLPQRPQATRLGQFRVEFSYLGFIKKTKTKTKNNVESPHTLKSRNQSPQCEFLLQVQPHCFSEQVLLSFCERYKPLSLLCVSVHILWFTWHPNALPGNARGTPPNRCGNWMAPSHTHRSSGC